MKSALTAIRDAISDVEGKKILIITDGYEAYVDAVFTVFPNTIHEGSFTVSEELCTFTSLKVSKGGQLFFDGTRFWNHPAILAKHNTKKEMGRGDTQERSSYASGVDRVKNIDTPLESRDTVYYYLGFKKHPVKRRRSGSKRCNSNSKTKIVRRRPKIKLLFKGRLSELVEKFEAAGEVIDTVRSVFVGRYITSNLAEYVFQFKP